MLHLPTLRDIQRGLAAGDAQNAFEQLSPLRGQLPAAYPKNAYTEKLLHGAAQKADELDAHLIPALPFDLFRLFEETGDRSQYEHIYFNEYATRNAVNALALLKTGEDKYRRALENGLWALCDAYTWALPAHLWGNGLKVLHDPGYEDGGRDEYACHDRPCTTEVDLFGSMMAHDVSQMLYLFGDTLSPLVVRRVREEIRRRIFDPLMTFD